MARGLATRSILTRECRVSSVGDEIWRLTGSRRSEARETRRIASREVVGFVEGGPRERTMDLRQNSFSSSCWTDARP